MSKKGENIYKRKDGRWEGRYIRFYDGNGKAKYGYVYGKTYSDVKQRLLEKKAWLNPKFCVNTVQQCKNRNYKYILKQAAAAFGVAALVTS